MANLLHINREALEFYGFILVTCTSIYQPSMVQWNIWSSNKEINNQWIFFGEFTGILLAYSIYSILWQYQSCFFWGFSGILLAHSTYIMPWQYQSHFVTKLHNFAIILKIISVNTPLHTWLFFSMEAGTAKYFVN